MKDAAGWGLLEEHLPFERLGSRRVATLVQPEVSGFAGTEGDC